MSEEISPDDLVTDAMIEAALPIWQDGANTDLSPAQVVARIFIAMQDAQDDDEPQFKMGDVLYLRSGSAPMTLINGDDSRVQVEWFERGRMVRRVYSARCLTHRRR